MFSAFFGHYLLNEGVVTARQLSSILERQDQVRLRLGVMAINDGFMTAAQVEQVHQLQEKRDRRFGEIAINEGLLQEVQLIHLLKQQKSEHLILAQALIDDGLLTLKAFEDYLESYKNSYEMTKEQYQALEEGNVSLVVKAFLAFESEDRDLYVDYVSLFLKNMIRFVDGHVSVDRIRKVEQVTMTHVLRQRLLTDDCKYLTAFSGDEALLIQLAGAYVEEPLTEMDEYTTDALGEFLNLHNGLFLVNQSDAGNEMDMTVQAYFEDMSVRSKHHLYIVPIYTSFGTLKLVIGKM